MQELNKLETLRDIIDKGEYIVALCGSGMMEECGIHPLKDQDRAYRIEERYGRSPEYLWIIGRSGAYGFDLYLGGHGAGGEAQVHYLK